MSAIPNARCNRPSMMNAPVTSPSSTTSASLKCRFSPAMTAASIAAWSAARRSANASAALSAAVRVASPASFGSSASYSPGAFSEGSRAVRQRWQPFSSAMRSRTSSLSANGSRPPYFSGR